MSWSSVIGQARVKKLLRRLFENDRLPHALLLYGPDGVGKEAVALELAVILNCDSGNWTACGTCPSCRQMRTLRHSRLKLIFALPSKDNEKTAFDKLFPAELEHINREMDTKARNRYHRITVPKAGGIKISSIRDIRRESSFRAKGTGRTVVVICEAEKMNPNAANALLKTLEEPTGEMVLILCTSKRDALIPTILSRCQQLRFDQLSEGDIANALMREEAVGADEALLAAQLANGSYSAALAIAHNETLIQREEIVEYLRKIVAYDPVPLTESVEMYVSRDRKPALGLFLAGLTTWFRDVLALVEGVDKIRNHDLRDSLEKFAAHYPDTRCSEAVECIESAIDMMPKNVHLPTLMIVLSQQLRRCILTEH